MEPPRYHIRKLKNKTRRAVAFFTNEDVSARKLRFTHWTWGLRNWLRSRHLLLAGRRTAPIGRGPDWGLGWCEPNLSAGLPAPHTPPSAEEEHKHGFDHKIRTNGCKQVNMDNDSSRHTNWKCTMWSLLRGIFELTALCVTLWMRTL